MKSSKVFLGTALLALLSACGGGGSSSTPTTISGKVIDGYIEGATVCLDLNSNGACDQGEPSDVTKAGGSYSLSYTGSTEGLHVISLIPDTAKDADNGGLTLKQAGRVGFTLMAPAPTTAAELTTVTPLTTMVSNNMIQSGEKDAAKVEADLKQQLGLATNLLNHDYKASTSESATKVAELAVAISNAIGAAQTVLTSSTAFRDAVGTSDSAAIKVAAQKAAVSLVVNQVIPSIVDKSSGGLNATVTTSNVIAATQSVADASSTQLALKANAPKAVPATIQAFLDGVVVGRVDSGRYVDANGNRTNYSDALRISYIRGDDATMTGSEKNMVLISSKWFSDFNDGSSYYLTPKGWLKEDVNGKGSAKDDCLSIQQTAEGPNQVICLTQYDYSSKKVSSLILEPCNDTAGQPIAGCSPDTVFPSGTYAYKLNMKFEEETFKLWVSETWSGYGGNINLPKATLDEFLKAMKDKGHRQATGHNCNTGFMITAYDAAKKTGTIAFADLSAFNSCESNYSNLEKATFSETRTFQVRTVHGQEVMHYQQPLIFTKNNPDDSASAANGMFASYEGRIYDGEYWTKGNLYRIGLDGQTKIGNKALLNTYLGMIKAPSFPY